MLSDLELADLCAACYSDLALFSSVHLVSDVWLGVKHYDDCTAIAFRGSTVLIDWFRDFEGWMIPDPDLGMVEDGFISGMRNALKAAYTAVSANNVKPVYITGHSLGAARALLFAGLWKRNPIARVTVFGSPRPGGPMLKELLSAVDIRSYRNGEDPVCDVPFTLPTMPYEHPRALRAINVPPEAGDRWGDIMGWHHIQKYQKGLQNGQDNPGN